MLEKVPAATLVESYFDFVGLTASKEFELDELKALINAFPDSDGKAALLKWVGQGVTNVEELRKRTFTYFSGVMDQAGATFRSDARSFVIILSILLTLLLGTDSIQMAQTLWDNENLRAIAVAKAEVVAQQEGADEIDIETLFKDLGELNVINPGWFVNERPAGGQPADWASFIFMKTLGHGLTMAAVSQGSSFWYYLLKKVTSPSTSSSSRKSSGWGSSSSTSSSSG